MIFKSFCFHLRFCLRFWLVLGPILASSWPLLGAQRPRRAGRCWLCFYPKATLRPKTASRRSKTPPRPSKSPPRCPKSRPRPPKTPPKTTQEPPKRAKIDRRHPKTIKNRLKTQTTQEHNTTQHTTQHDSTEHNTTHNAEHKTTQHTSTLHNFGGELLYWGLLGQSWRLLGWSSGPLGRS